jgi:enediyne biosynthesis thioesterase
MPFVKTPLGNYCYEFRFHATFEESNLVGNIYFANYAVWQGKCREMFIKEYCPSIVRDIEDGLKLITLDMGVQYMSQLFSLDHIVIHMTLKSQSFNRLLMEFTYYKEENGELVIAATGHQATSTMRIVDNKLKPVEIPIDMQRALEHYHQLNKSIITA